jgi:hypothetical protein
MIGRPKTPTEWNVTRAGGFETTQRFYETEGLLTLCRKLRRELCRQLDQASTNNDFNDPCSRLRLDLIKPLVQLPQGAAHFEPRAILEDHGKLTPAQGFQFANSAEVHDHRTTDAHESSAVQSRF